MKTIILALLVVFAIAKVQAQVLDASEKVTITLSDDVQVTLYKKTNSFDEVAEDYYYVPAHIKFSTTKNNEPEFSFLSYKEGNQTKGAILHFLVSWGLTKKQLEEASEKLKTIKPSATLMGGVIPVTSIAKEGFTIEGPSSIVKILQRSKTTIGRPALMTNTKIAASFKLNKEDAEILGEALRSNSKELTKTFLVMNFQIKLRNKGERMAFITDYQLKQNFRTLLNQ